MKTVRVMVMMLATLALMAGCQGGGGTSGSTTPPDDSPVYAKMDGKVITEKVFNDELDKISPFAKNQFKGVEGKKRMLDRMIQNEVLYKAALDAGYDKDPDVVRQIEDYKKTMIVREYYKKEIQEKSSISDDELRNYYEENKDKYKEKARVKVRHILCNSENEAKRILAELDRGADFKKLAKEKSKDKLSSKREGLLGNVTEGGYIPTIGRDEQIERILFSTPVHHYTGVVESKKGYHIFYIEEKKEPRQKDFEEVKEIIEGELKRTRMRDEFDAVIDSLKQAYHVEIFENNLAADTTDTGNASSGENNIFGENKKPVELKFKTNEKNDDADKAKQGKLDVDEMFELAGTLMDQPVKALEIYNRIIREFPQDPSVYKAEFMVGFINAENLGDTAAASVAFRELIKKYPESDLADDAAYMLKEIKKGKLAAGEDTKKNLLT